MDFRQIFENSSEPLVIKNAICDWVLIKYDETSWSKLFNGKNLTFRKGSKLSSTTPTWERMCSKVNMTLPEFFETSKAGTSSHWLYFDYKHINEVFPENDSIFQDLNWGNLGFPNVTGKDSTLWIGNAGAHTPCHMDTYGFNLVAQIFGRKFWVLIPPNEMDRMKPTRVPYEESSIYSDINFYTPTKEIANIRKIYLVIMEPGDVLYVPRHWWHYVENLNTAISLNTWIPMDEDDESRLEEALVQRLILSFCQDLSEDYAKEILNPNEALLLTEIPNNNFIEAAVSRCLQFRKKAQNSAEIKKREVVKEDSSKVIERLVPLTKQEILQYLDCRYRFHDILPDLGSDPKPNASRPTSMHKSVINAFCHPNVISLIKEKLLLTLNEV